MHLSPHVSPPIRKVCWSASRRFAGLRSACSPRCAGVLRSPRKRQPSKRRLTPIVPTHETAFSPVAKKAAKGNIRQPQIFYVRENSRLLHRLCARRRLSWKNAVSTRHTANPVTPFHPRRCRRRGGRCRRKPCRTARALSRKPRPFNRRPNIVSVIAFLLASAFGPLTGKPYRAGARQIHFIDVRRFRAERKAFPKSFGRGLETFHAGTYAVAVAVEKSICASPAGNAPVGDLPRGKDVGDGPARQQKEPRGVCLQRRGWLASWICTARSEILPA
jgi:hypothetical protein